MNTYPAPPQVPNNQANAPSMNYYQPPPGVVPAPNPDAFQFAPIGQPNGSPLFADDFAFLGDDGGDNGDPKRRRIARACDMCRKKKIKCDGKMPACTHCQNYKTECIFTQVEKKRNPPKGAKYIEGLENRLGRMESLLRLSGILAEDGDDDTDLSTLEKRLTERRAKDPKDSLAPDNDAESTRHSVASSQGPERENGASASNSPRPAIALNDTPVTSPDPPASTREEEVEALSDMMCSLVTNNCGETRYIGSSSGFSIFSPKGIQWVNEKTGDTSFQDMISTAAVDDNKWIHWKPDVFRDIFSRRVFKPLPPKEEALSLLRDYFQNFNCMFPLFHEPTFMYLVDKHYSRDPYEGSGWWASLNVALAIAHRLRVMSNLVPQDEDQKAWGYLKNALAVQTELTIRNTDLLSVQALLGMALFLQGTPNPQPSFFLVAAAIRLSHSIGLHKRGSGFNLSASEVEQRKRVFWIAYLLDRDICLRSGRPPIQDDDDMNVELPSEDPADNVGNIPLADGKGKVNLFRLMCTFAVIQSKVYKQLYSVKASKQSDGELLNTIGELDKELEDWKDGIPVDFRPEHEIKASHTPLILHVVVLHFAYYNCLTTIHRMSVHHGYWTSRLSNYAIQGLNARPLNPRVFSSAALCVSAARASINLIKYIPQGDFACVWLILYYPVSALVTLFANILQNPQDSRTRSDLKLMNLVVSFLSTLCSDEANGSVRRMLNVCAEFERIAKVVLDKADKESHSRRKRKQGDANDATKKEDSATAPSRQGHERSRSTASSGATPHNSASGRANGSMSQVFTPSSDGSHANGSHQRSTSSSRSLQSNSPRLHGGALPGAGSSPNAPYSQGYSPQPPLGFPTPGAAGIFPDNLSGLSSAPPGMSTPGSDPLNLGSSFQQPFVPQDLWQMPMTLEWDWADMTGTGGASMMSMDGIHGGLATTGVEGGVQAGDNLSGTMGMGIQGLHDGSHSGSSMGGRSDGGRTPTGS